MKNQLLTFKIAQNPDVLNEWICTAHQDGVLLSGIVSSDWDLGILYWMSNMRTMYERTTVINRILDNVAKELLL